MLLLSVSLLLAACSESTTPASTALPAPDLTLPDGLRAEVYATGLRRPTALAVGPDDALYLTQLAGDENAGAGEVVRIAQPGATPQTVLTGLSKPTGLTWRAETLWIVAGRDLLRTTMQPAGTLAPPTTVLRDLPFNGRSNGQVTLLPDGRLLFTASGSVRDPDSGTLLTLDPDTQRTPQVLATGLKNAYAHAVDPATGRIFTTEIGDDLMNGAPPPDELNQVQPGADYGWPQCFADQQPARDRGGTAADCATTQPPVVQFAPRSTPTGLVWYAGDAFPAAYRAGLYVALWHGDPPRVDFVQVEEQAGHLGGTATPFVGGLERPIAVLPDSRGGLLIVDEGAGSVYRVVAE
jgi:glucose/arabinose dehydrogenase